MRDLGHVDNLLGNRRHTRDEELKNVRQMFLHLQHRSIESLDQLVPDAAVPLNLPLRPGLQHGSRPHPCRGLAIIRRELKVLGRSQPGAGADLLSP